MVKLYYPPAALLPQGNREFVELAGAKCILAIDEEKQFIVVTDIFSELSWGEFWKTAAISDQIEKITIKHDDSEAIYNPEILKKRIISAFEKIMERKLLFFGVASFEGNAFETSVFDEIDLSIEETDKLMNLYKAKRVKNAFPNVKKGQYVEINFFGSVASYFTLPNARYLRDIAEEIVSYEGFASGIVAVAQGAANFIILTENLSSPHPYDDDRRNIKIDKKNLNQMFNLLKRSILEAPISWFKIDLGLRSLETLDGWDEIKEDPEIIDIKLQYLSYINDIIMNKPKKSPELIMAEDLGNPINIEVMSKEEIQADIRTLEDVLTVLENIEAHNEAVSLLYYPPKILFYSATRTGAAIGGAQALLSTDVGKNIICVGDLQQDLTWGQFYEEEQSDNISFFGLEDQEFFELENPMQLCNLYIRAFQNIIKGNQLFLGLLELESNAFEFSLFREIEIPDDDIEKIRAFYYEKSKSGNFPRLKDGYITIKWFGDGQEYFTNYDCLGILDLAEKISTLPVYKNGYVAGIVCVDEESTYFYILANNFHEEPILYDYLTGNLLIRTLETTKQAPLCWFKITLGLESLKKHPYWKTASQYTSLLMVLDNYQKYVQTLRNIKKKEEQYRLFNKYENTHQ